MASELSKRTVFNARIPSAPISTQKSGNRVSLATPAELKRPEIAWPTIAVFIAALSLFFGVAFSTFQSPTWKTVPLSAIALFWLFTPLHDSAHRSVSQRYKWINHVIGRVCGLLFIAPFPAFRYVHLQHHKHCNDPEKDPDMWSGTGPTILKPLRWVSQELHYYIPYFAVLFKRGGFELVESLGTLVGAYYAVYCLYAAGHGWAVLWTWALPVRIAVFFLAYSFDYIPHRPHTVTAAQDPYKCTSRVVGVVGTGKAGQPGYNPSGIADRISDAVLSVTLLYQNYHNIHHLYPTIPFYRYPVLWWSHRKELLELGTPVEPLYSAATPWW